MEKLHDIGLGNDFLVMILRVQVTKVKTDKLSYIKIKNFCTPEFGYYPCGKKKTCKTDEISASHLSVNGLISKIYKALKRNNKTQLIMGKGLKQTFLQRRYTYGQ